MKSTKSFQPGKLYKITRSFQVGDYVMESDKLYEWQEGETFLFLRLVNDKDVVWLGRASMSGPHVKNQYLVVLTGDRRWFLPRSVIGCIQPVVLGC